LVAVIDSGASEMNADAFAELASLVAKNAGAAAADLTHSQASLGNTKSRVTSATSRMEIRRNVLERVVGGLESVDQVEASARLNNLTTQLQVSYAVTARMFKLSLLDYL
jgi:flagellar hook-associated protein 3 FlgL